MYYAKSRNYVDKLNEIGEKEGEYIRKYNPILNTQKPKEENWAHYDVREIDTEKIIE